MKSRIRILFYCSHMFEKFVSQVRKGFHWCHESASIAIFEKIYNENPSVFQKYGIEEQDITFIKVGSPPFQHMSMLKIQLSGDYLRSPGWCLCVP